MLRCTRAIAASLVMVLAACSSGDDDASRDAVVETTTTVPPGPLTVLVTNDDGIGHPGLDTLVGALQELEAVEVEVVAPAADRTGSSDMKTDGGASYAAGRTASGIEGTAVDGFPADTITVALDDLGLEPDLVVSGINQGQNVGPLAYVSGTVGAAREAVRRGIPAIAGSAGPTAEADYAAAAEYIVQHITENRAAYAGGTAATDTVTNFNVPHCTSGFPQPLHEVPLAMEIPEGVDPFSADCSLEPAGAPADDVAAVATGYAAVTPVPPEPPAG